MFGHRVTVVVGDITIDGSEIFYLGVPTGDRYRPYVARAMFEALDSVLSRK